MNGTTWTFRVLSLVAVVSYDPRAIRVHEVCVDNAA